jgi:colanic acid/amylovoran biosynthesis glycosyltransferase
MPRKVRRMLLTADCFVLAAVIAPDGDSDATPTVLGEAMALGLPVISTRVAGIPEIVPEGAGLLVRPGDPQALAEAIAQVAALADAERHAMGQQGRAFVHRHWNGARDAPALAAWFQQAASGHLRPSTTD